MKQSTKEFLHLISPLGLEEPFSNLNRNKRIYKIWRKSQLRNQWRNLKIWFLKYFTFKKTYTNPTGWLVYLWPYKGGWFNIRNIKDIFI